MPAPDVSAGNGGPQAAAAAEFGEVYDRGYQHYDGARLGRRQALRSLIVYSMSRALGLRRPWTAKIIPILIYVAVFGTAVVVIGIEAFLSEMTDRAVVTYHDFFGLIFVLEGIFVATIAPEMVCPDRRQNVLTLYFSKAITRLDYIIAKLAAIALLTLSLSFVPAALLWLFRALLAPSPLSVLYHSLDDLARIALVGVLIAFYLGSIGLAVSSFTGRKAIAIAVIIVGYLVTEGLVRGAHEALAGHAIADWLVFLSPALSSTSLTATLFSATNTPITPAFGWWAYALAMLVTVIIAVALAVWRYLPRK